MPNILFEYLKEGILIQEKEIKAAYERDTGHTINYEYLAYTFGDKETRAISGGTLFEYFLYKQFYRFQIYKKFICNPILKTKNGTTEIDVIMITNKGIFVFECKHYAGNIYGDVKSRNWLYYLGGKKYSFYNPVMQNKGHIQALMNELNLESKYFGSIIIFSENANIKIKGLETERTTIATTKSMYRIFVSQVDSLPDLLSNEQVDAIYNQLLKYCNYDASVKEEHIENKNKCPRCGGNLILRKSKTGSSFYGCESFPKCRYTRNV